MNRYILLILILCMTTPSRSQESRAYRGTLHLDSVGVYEQGDSLHVNLRITVENEVIERRQGLRLIPSLATTDTLVYLPCITVEGTNKKRVRDRWRKDTIPSCHCLGSRKETTGTYPYRYSTLYEEWMDSARFVLYQEVIGHNDRRGLLSYHLPSAIEREPMIPYEVQPRVSYVIPEREEKRRKRQGRAFIDFQVGRSVILPQFRNNPEELQKIRYAIDELHVNPDIELHKIYIEGYASPEGTYATNERLSRERSIALKEYLKKQFNFPENLFHVSYVAEDWEGVLASVHTSEMNYKQDVLRIIDEIDIFDGRESALMKLGRGTVWRRMVAEMFPPLRRVEYQIDYSVRAYTLEESTVLLTQKPEDLSQRELYLLAEYYGKGSKEYEQILLDVIPRLFPDDAVANHNMAALLIEKGEYTTALRYLEKSGESAATLNNRGILYLLSGHTGEAMSLFESATVAGVPEAEHNLREAILKKEDNDMLSRRGYR